MWVPSVSVKLRIAPTWSPALPSSISLCATRPLCQVARPLKSRMCAQTSSGDAPITVLAYDFAIWELLLGLLVDTGPILRRGQPRLRRLADLRQRLPRRQRLRVDAQLDERRPAARERLVECGGEVLGPLDRDTVGAEGARERGEVRD